MSSFEWFRNTFFRWPSGRSRDFVIQPNRIGGVLHYRDRGRDAVVIWLGVFAIPAAAFAFFAEDRDFRKLLVNGEPVAWLFAGGLLAPVLVSGYRILRTVLRVSEMRLDLDRGELLVRQTWPARYRQGAPLREAVLCMQPIEVWMPKGGRWSGFRLYIEVHGAYFTIAMKEDPRALETAIPKEAIAMGLQVREIRELAVTGYPC